MKKLPVVKGKMRKLKEKSNFSFIKLANEVF